MAGRSKHSPLAKHGDGLKREYPDIIAAIKNNAFYAVEEFLIENPELVYAKDKRHMTTMHWAAANKNVDIVRLLHKYEIPGRDRLVLAKDILQRTPLEIALGWNHRELIDTLSAMQFPEMFDPNSEWNSDDPPKKIIEFPKPEPE